MNFFYNRECCQKIKRSHIFNEWFLFTDLFESQLIFVYIFVSCLFTKNFPLRLKIRLKMPTLVMYKICLLNVGRWWKFSCLFTIVSWLFRFPFERGSCRTVFRLLRKIPCLRGSFCKAEKMKLKHRFYEIKAEICTCDPSTIFFRP